jgi:predicted RNA-binding protein with PUA-like domain
MNYWLIKSEPSAFSWKDMKSKGITSWDGVRNYQARNFIKQMKVGDLCLFYHSVNDKKIMGIVQVIKEAYPDPTDETGKFCMMDVKFHQDLKKQLSLEEIKTNPKLADLLLVKQSRLSVMPVSKSQWSMLTN